MKVTVAQGIRVVHDGTVYQNGESVDVPEDLARDWVHRGWAAEGDVAAPVLRDPRGLSVGVPPGAGSTRKTVSLKGNRAR